MSSAGLTNLEWFYNTNVKYPGRLVKDEVREAKFGCTFAASGFYKVA